MISTNALQITRSSSICSLVYICIWTAAIYTAHHYVMDVLIGILVAITGHYIYEKYAKSKIEPWIIKRRKAHLRVEE